MSEESLFFPAGAALVVGGSGCIGQAIALALADAGSQVAVTHKSRESAAAQVDALVEERGQKATSHALDL